MPKALKIKVSERVRFSYGYASETKIASLMGNTKLLIIMEDGYINETHKRKNKGEKVDS